MVQIFGAKRIVGEKFSRFRRHVIEVLGVPQPAIVMSELLGLYQDLVLGCSVMERASKPLRDTREWAPTAPKRSAWSAST